MGRHCVIFGCNSKHSIGTPLVKFPDDQPRRNQWIEFVAKVSGIDKFTPNTASRLCHKHFDSELISGRSLKTYAVPTKSNVPPGKKSTRRNAAEAKKDTNNTLGNIITNERELETILFKIRQEKPNWFFQKSGLDYILYQSEASSIPKIVHGVKISAGLKIQIFAKNKIIDFNVILTEIAESASLTGTLILKICTYLEDIKYESIVATNKSDLLTPLDQEKSFENIRLLLNGEESICRFCFARAADTDMGTLKYISYDTKEHFNELTSESMCTTPKLGDRICESCIHFIRDAVKVRNAVLNAERLLLKFAEYFPNLPPEYSKEILDVSLENTESVPLELQEHSSVEIDVENIIEYDPQSDSDEEAQKQSSNEIKMNHNEEKLEQTLDKQEDDWLMQEGYSISIDEAGKKEYECKKCNKNFAKKYTLDYHFKRSSMHSAPVSDATCNICGASFYDQPTLKRHMAMVHDTKKIQCEICGRAFNAYHLALHMKRHKKLDHACAYCDKKFESNFRLQNHVRSRHTHEKPFDCSHCKISFSTRTLLCQHITKNHPEVQKNFLCTKCGQRFWTKQALASHQKNCNSPTMSQIFVVNQKPRSKKNYKSQSISKPYCCQICSKTFPTKIQLEDHEKKHVNDEINICLDCGASFARKDGLKVHLQTIHLKEFEYFCQFCKKGFVSLSAKRQHENIHTNDQKYTCDLCSKSFKRANTLNVHIESVHKNKRYRCKWCLEIGAIKEIRKFSTFIQHVRKYHEHEFDSDEDLNEQIIVEK